MSHIANVQMTRRMKCAGNYLQFLCRLNLMFGFLILWRKLPCVTLLFLSASLLLFVFDFVCNAETAESKWLFDWKNFSCTKVNTFGVEVLQTVNFVRLFIWLFHQKLKDSWTFSLPISFDYRWRFATLPDLSSLDSLNFQFTDVNCIITSRLVQKFTSTWKSQEVFAPLLLAQVAVLVCPRSNLLFSATWHSFCVSCRCLRIPRTTSCGFRRLVDVNIAD